MCYVDLSREFVPGNDTEEKEREAVWALVQTLTGLDAVNSVSLTIEGEAGGLSYVDPVSYTHLDVYKRQVLGEGFERYSKNKL